MFCENFLQSKYKRNNYMALNRHQLNGTASSKKTKVQIYFEDISKHIIEDRDTAEEHQISNSHFAPEKKAVTIFFVEFSHCYEL